MEEHAQYGVHCTHILETLHGVTNIRGRLLYRILSNLEDKFTAHGQNSVRPLSKVWLWPHQLYTKPETPQRQEVAICTELNHRCPNNAGGTERSSFRVLSKARLSVGQPLFHKTCVCSATFCKQRPHQNLAKIRQTVFHSRTVHVASVVSLILQLMQTIYTL
jgi:hypothetical protein